MPALAITPASDEINVGRTSDFTASGGTPPYTFSLVAGEPNEDVGSLDSAATTTEFTAPRHSGRFGVKVTDSAGTPATATALVTVHTPLTWFCKIIKAELGLANEQVYLWDQKINIPTDFRMYVAIGVQNIKPFGNRRVYDPTTGLEEAQSGNFQATLSIDVLSRGPEARDRKEELVLALRSTYAEQVMEANGFYIAGLTTAFVNLSQLDGAAIPYRFNLSVALQYTVSKSKAVDYYDDFTLDDVLIDPAPPDTEEDDG